MAVERVGSLSRSPVRPIADPTARVRVVLKDTKNNYVSVCVSHIRKLDPDPAHPRQFLTEPCSGVRSDSNEPSGADWWDAVPAALALELDEESD
jgi:hypothetical protein